MAVRLYNEYIKVDPNFIPVFSRNSDKTYPDKWQSFYPHDSFKKILREVVETLEKSNASKDNSIWMSGAYGTGKTYASFVIKHILEDDIESIEPYFEKNNMQALLARINGIRSKGKTLVVHRSSSAGIDNQDKLFSAIIESVRSALADAGLDYMGVESVSDKVITMLKHPETSAFNFEGAFNKYRAKFTDYASVNSVIKDLEDLEDEERLELLNTIIDVASKEGFNWSMDSEEIINWLEDVRKGNGLYSIVFIWDEFTEYFRNNQNKISGLQEIAMASSRINFYFFLITHSSAGQLIQNKESKKIIEARFKLNTIELEESTAFKLLGQAIGHEKDLKDEWEYTSDKLWNSVKRKSVDVIKGKDYSVQDNDFKQLLPMHPYAAYLLKFIAKDISSNQRTIFQFLSGDFSGDDTKTNFKWFIDNFAFEEGKWNYLTIDYLWNYFCTTENVDLDSSFIQTISHYNNFASVCDEGQQNTVGDRRRRVLKGILLLYALQTKNGAESRTGATSLMRATLENVRACFAGTPLESTLDSDLDFFDTKGIIGKIETPKETYFVMTSAAIDTDRMKKKVEETKKEIPFEKLIADPAVNIAKAFVPDKKDFLNHRLNIDFVSVNNSRKTADNCEISDNRIPTFFLFAKNEAEQAKVSDAVKTIYDLVGEKCIIVDFSALPLTDALFNKFIESKAREKYFQTLSNQSAQSNLAKKTADDTIKEWTRKLLTTSLVIYSSPEKSVTKVGGANLRRTLKEINADFYGCGIEELTYNDKLFAETGYKATVAQMAMGKIAVPNNYSYLRGFQSRLDTDGIWNDPKYWNTKPEHPVSKMKIAINEVIEKSFKQKTMVSIIDVWKCLTKPPFGLMPNTGSCFILGFLLNEYADTNYYQRDINNNSTPLNYISLSELIFTAMKGLPKAQGQFIVKQTSEQKEFCRITGEIFKIANSKRSSVDSIAVNVNIFLSNNKYPLWAMKYFIEEELYDNLFSSEMLRLTELLCEFVKPDKTIDRDRSKVVKEIYELYSSNPGIEKDYGDVLSAENMRTGMDYYIAQYKPALITTANSLQIDNKVYLDQLTAKLSSDASYLWEIGDTDHQIDNLYVDLRLIFDINRVLNTKQKTFSDAKKALIDKLNIIKVPYLLLIELKPELKPIMEQFIAIRENTLFNKEVASTVISGMADDFLVFFNNQFKVFCQAIDVVLNTKLEEDEYEDIYNNVPSGVLFEKTDKFGSEMQRRLVAYRRNKKTRKMHDEWKKLTGTESPEQWSKIHGIPVLCMFTNDITRSQRVFNALNHTANLPSENDIDDAISFLSSGALDVLKDIPRCEKEFMRLFTGEFSYIITVPDELRDIIRNVAGSKVYDWYYKMNLCRGKIKEFATQRYKTTFCTQAKEKVKSLSAEEAQNYLNKLIEDDPLLGISILKK